LAQIELKRGSGRDAEAIRALVLQAYAKWVPLIGREPKPMTTDYDLAVLEHRFDLLLVDGHLAGLLETIERDDGLLIENVAVAPNRQRQGFGRMLMSHAERLAREAGKARVRLYTNQRFEENVRLYLNLGYGIDREEDLGFAVAVHMSKGLADR
jgi:GNAT superfamily N-acetyltransferase